MYRIIVVFDSWDVTVKEDFVSAELAAKYLVQIVSNGELEGKTFGLSIYSAQIVKYDCHTCSTFGRY